MGTQTLLTLEQFDELPDVEGVLYELDEGEVVIMTEPMPRHNFARENIADLLRAFAHPRKLGRVCVETGYQLAPETVRIPDVSFILADRVRGLDLDRRIVGAPALAVEVVSPTDLAQNLARKADQYLAAGAREVWVVYPLLREVHVFRAGGEASVLGADDVLARSELLPGFSIPVSPLFE